MALDRLLKPIVDVRKEESTGVLLMFCYSFLAMTAYNILKPITRSQFIEQPRAPTTCPGCSSPPACSSACIMQGYSQGDRPAAAPLGHPGDAGRHDRRCCVVFWLLFRTGADWVSVAFYFFGLILGILLISQFWTLANDDLRSAAGQAPVRLHRRRLQPRRAWPGRR